RCHDLDLQADATLLRAAEQGRMLGPAVLLDAWLAYQLIDRWHSLLPWAGKLKRNENPAILANPGEAITLCKGGKGVKTETAGERRANRKRYRHTDNSHVLTGSETTTRLLSILRALADSGDSKCSCQTRGRRPTPRTVWRSGTWRRVRA